MTSFGACSDCSAPFIAASCARRISSIPPARSSTTRSPRCLRVTEDCSRRRSRARDSRRSISPPRAAPAGSLGVMLSPVEKNAFEDAMSLYSIYVLEYGYVPEYDKGGVIYGAHNEGYIKLPYCYAVIKGRDWAAMVDVGYNDRDYGKYLGDLFNVQQWRPPHVVLGEIGLKPEDIRAVFITHAHFDHFGNVEAFPSATFYIQKRELQEWVWAMSLPDRMRWVMCGIDTGDILRGVQLAREKRLVALDGPVENIFPGIDLHVAYDSHTWACMWVAVRNDGQQSSKDVWVLAG